MVWGPGEKNPRLPDSSQDIEIARRLANDLKKLSVRVWLAEDEVLVGENLADKIHEGLARSDYMAVVLTRASVSSPRVNEDLEIVNQNAESGVRTCIILPLMFEFCEMPPSIKSLRYADFTCSYSKGFADLARATGIVISETRTNAFEPDFWDKIDRRIDACCKTPVDPISLEEARRKGNYYLSNSILAFYYTLKNDMRIRDYENNDYMRFNSYIYEYDDMDVLVQDHAKVKIWRSFILTLDNMGSFVRANEQALHFFKQNIINSIYSKRNEMKHERDVIGDIAIAVNLIRSIC